MLPTITVDGVTLLFRVGGVGPLPTDTNGVEWVCTKLEGWAGTPKPRANRADRPFGPGAFRSQSFASSRTVAAEFVVTAPDSDTLRQVEQQLGAWCSLGGQLYDLTVNDPPIRPLVARVERDDAVLIAPRNWNSITVATQFEAPDPRKYDQYWIDRTTIVPVPSTGGLDFTSPGLVFTAPGLQFGPPPVVSIAQVANYGTAPVGPFFTISGAVTQPRVVDLSTGWSMQYTGTMSAGDVLTVNCDEFPARGQGGHTALLNGVTNVWGQVVRSADWPIINPQVVATYQITAAPQIVASATLVVSVRSAWW